MQRIIFVLGATGFIGHEVVTQALATGWQVKALARSGEAAARLRADGVVPVDGDAAQPKQWIREAQDAVALVDLVQMKLPARITIGQISRISAERQALTQNLIAAIQSLPGEQPLYFSVSGADDLQLDGRGAISHRSPLRSQAIGFSRIGIPVRRLIEASGIAATYLYLGNIVYGPGKVFADQYVRGLKTGRAVIVGSGANRLPLIHVSDAAGGLLHLAQMPRNDVSGQSWVIMDGADTTQRQLINDTADLMGVRHAIAIPRGIAGLVAGRAAVETITLDAHADPSALLATGYTFRYPSHREGVPATLAQMGIPMPSKK